MTGRTVWKFTIPVDVLSASFASVLHIPVGARFLRCAEQHGSVALWYEIPAPDAEKLPRSFQLFGTGTGPIRQGLEYIGTTQHASGDLILHVYEDVTP